MKTHEELVKEMQRLNFLSMCRKMKAEIDASWIRSVVHYVLIPIFWCLSFALSCAMCYLFIGYAYKGQYLSATFFFIAWIVNIVICGEGIRKECELRKGMKNATRK